LLMKINPLEKSTEPVNRRVAAGLAKIALAMRNRSWHEAGARGITPTQGQILAFLYTRPEQAMMLGAVAAGVAISEPTACDSVQTLVKKGLVKKVKSAADRRARAISLTVQGRKEAARVAGWPDFIAEAVEVLPMAEQEALLLGLVKTIQALQEAQEIPVSRMCVTCHYFRPNVHDDLKRPHHCEYVDAPFGDSLIRIDCGEHVPATPEEHRASWKVFTGTQG
jgi:DNA-binding MarR family transcriptional regulator